MVGAWLSVTTTVNWQVAVLPDASVARKTLVVVPVGNDPPLATPDVWVVNGAGQLSVTTGAVYVTVAAHVFTITFAVAFAGHVIRGA